MPTFREYGQALSLEPTDAFAISRLGAGTLYVEASAIGGGGSVGSLIGMSGVELSAGQFYAVQTSLGAFSGSLPDISTVIPGSYLEVADGDNNAGANPYVVNAFGGDAILDHGATASSYAININNTITRFIANVTGWRVITYGA